MTMLISTITVWRFYLCIRCSRQHNCSTSVPVSTVMGEVQIWATVKRVIYHGTYLSRNFVEVAWTSRSGLKFPNMRRILTRGYVTQNSKFRLSLEIWNLRWGNCEIWPGRWKPMLPLNSVCAPNMGQRVITRYLRSSEPQHRQFSPRGAPHNSSGIGVGSLFSAEKNCNIFETALSRRNARHYDRCDLWHRAVVPPSNPMASLFYVR